MNQLNIPFMLFEWILDFHTPWYRRTVYVFRYTCVTLLNENSGGGKIIKHMHFLEKNI